MFETLKKIAPALAILAFAAAAALLIGYGIQYDRNHPKNTIVTEDAPVAPVAPPVARPVQCKTEAQFRAEADAIAAKLGVKLDYQTYSGPVAVALIAFYNSVPPVSDAKGDYALIILPTSFQPKAYLAIFNGGCATMGGFMTPAILKEINRRWPLV